MRLFRISNSSSEARLILFEKRARLRSMTHQLECAEVLAPRSIRYFRVAANPFHELQKVRFGNFSCSKPVFKMVAQLWWKRMPIDVGHGLVRVGHAKHHFFDFPSTAGEL